MRNEIQETDLYTSLEEAKEEIWRRWDNSDLRDKVAAYIGSEPSFLKRNPKAYLARYITTPNFELFKFLKLAGQIQLPPVSAEFRGDHFVSTNCDKYALGKLQFFRKGNKTDKTLFSHRKVVNFCNFEGVPLRSVQTIWNEPLIDFHHRLLQRYSLDLEIVDASDWLYMNGDRAEEYYSHFLALFICHAVLFENFITNEEEPEEKFSRNVVFPAFRQVVNHFGIKPLIVPLVPHDVASDIYWRCYPAELEAEVIRCLSECKVKDSLGHHHEGRYDEKGSGHYESQK